jgi:hypothetical protein
VQIGLSRSVGCSLWDCFLPGSGKCFQRCFKVFQLGLWVPGDGEEQFSVGAIPDLRFELELSERNAVPSH